MKRIALFALGLMALSTPAIAQDDTAKAVLALPANLREGATVIKWKPDFTYDTLKKGTNTLVSYDLSGMPKHQPFTVERTGMGNRNTVGQNRRLGAMGDKTRAA